MMAIRRDQVVSRWHRRGLLGLLGVHVLMLLAVLIIDPRQDSLLLLAGLIAIGILLLVAVSWGSLPQRTPHLMIWPLMTIAALTVFGSLQPSAGRLIDAVYVLSFLYVGLCQRVGRGLWLLLPAAVSYWLVQDLSPAEATLRVALAAVVWMIVAEVPARLLRRIFTAQRELSVAAQTDSLTGLRSRYGMARALSDCDASWCLVLFDLDQFKQYNDAHGHIRGDELLTAFSGLLRTHTRRDDLVYRFGGDEFLVMLASTSVQEGTAMAGRVSREWGSFDPSMRVSVGVASGGPEALQRADSCLYQAKQAGAGVVAEAERPVRTTTAAQVPGRTASD